MRVNANTDPHEQRRRTRVFLDGREVYGCMSADDVEGWVEIIVKDGGPFVKGGPYQKEPDPDRPGHNQLSMQRLKGVVTIVRDPLPESAPGSDED